MAADLRVFVLGDTFADVWLAPHPDGVGAYVARVTMHGIPGADWLFDAIGQCPEVLAACAARGGFRECPEEPEDDGEPYSPEMHDPCTREWIHD